MSLTLILGVKNNLEYTKNFYTTTRKIYPDVEISIASYGSTDGTNEWLDSTSKIDKNFKVYHESNSKTISDSFNKAAEMATNNYIVFCHNDIVLAPGFCESLMNLMDIKTCVTYMTIEPPIFGDHKRPGKIIKDYGTDISSFQYDKFIYDCNEYRNKLITTTTNGWAFFMCMNKDQYFSIGGMDNLFDPMFCEDDDLRLRLEINKFKFIVAENALSYHFVSKTSRFESSIINQTNQFELNSNINFIRKWGFRHSNYNRSRELGLLISLDSNVENQDELIKNSLPVLEPWFKYLYLPDKFKNLVVDYIDNTQHLTKIDLKSKFRYTYPELDVYISIKLNNTAIYNLASVTGILQDVICQEDLETGTYEVCEGVLLIVRTKYITII